MPRTVFLLEGVVVGYARKAMNLSNITHHQYKHIIEHRVKVISFHDRYGQAATYEAFGTSRSTLYLWKQKLKAGQGRLEALAPGSTAPKRRRKREVDLRITDFIIRERTEHHRLGKDKLTKLLGSECLTWGLAPPCASTVGRILGDLKDQGRLPTSAKLSLSGRTGKLLQSRAKPKLKKQRRGGYQPAQPGDLLQLDTIEKFINGLKRYVLTAVDYHGRFAFAYGYSSPSSANAADFLDKLTKVAPFKIARVHHDNGSEFYKYFIKACEERNIVQLWNWPKQPRYNGMVERFNRSIQEEFIDWQLEDLAYNLDQFNQELMDWLVWYNTVRPHHSLKLKSPMAYLLELLQLSPEKSNMLWTDTRYCQIYLKLL